MQILKEKGKTKPCHMVLYIPFSVGRCCRGKDCPDSSAPRPPRHRSVRSTRPAPAPLHPHRRRQTKQWPGKWRRRQSTWENGLLHLLNWTSLRGPGKYRWIVRLCPKARPPPYGTSAHVGSQRGDHAQERGGQEGLERHVAQRQRIVVDPTGDR